MELVSKQRHCIFCNTKSDRVIEQNELCFAREDKYPVTKLHTLIIPNRHVQVYFDLEQSEVSAIHSMLIIVRQRIQDEDGTVTGFNIGVNSGKAAGQSIFHLHIHLIPRRNGDVENPQGGVRGVIPNKMHY